MKNKVLLISLAVVLALSVGLIGCEPEGGVAGTLYIGGNFGLTGPWAEDCQAVLAAFQDYADYINDTHKMSPWSTDTFPEAVTLEVKFMDDLCISPTQALTNYETLKDQGLLVQRISGSPIATAMLDVLAEDDVGATTQASGPYLLTPPKTIFMNYPIYTDQLAAIADWFLEGWNATYPGMTPKVCYLNNDTFGRTVPTPEMTAYLESIGYDVVLPNQEVPSVPESSPTAAWEFIKEHDIDLVLGAHTNIGSIPLMRWATEQEIGLNLAHNVTFGFCSPSHLVVYLQQQDNPAVNGNGLVIAGSYPAWADPCQGMVFCNYLQDTYGEEVTHIMYAHGVVEAMIQVEALRLALENTGKDVEDLTSADVLYQGFFKITDLDTGGIIPTTITFSVGDVEGAEEVVLHQNQAGSNVKLGSWPLHHIYTPVG